MFDYSVLIRILVGLSLSTFFISVIYFEYEQITCIVVYFICMLEICTQKINSLYSALILFGINVYVLFGLSCMYRVYLHEKYRIIFMITCTQLSDVIQYFMGRQFGSHHIGWVSPKKTYEGYGITLIILGMVGLILDILFRFTPSLFGLYIRICGIYGCFIEMVSIIILGALGGILFSLVKRYLQIKDWSNLLGPHGGLLDRLDSIFLPAFYMYCLN